MFSLTNKKKISLYYPCYPSIAGNSPHSYSKLCLVTPTSHFRLDYKAWTNRLGPETTVSVFYSQ